MVQTRPLSFVPIDTFPSVFCFKKMAPTDFVNMLSPVLCPSNRSPGDKGRGRGHDLISCFFTSIPAGLPGLFLQVEDCTMILLLFYFISSLRILI